MRLIHVEPPEWETGDGLPYGRYLFFDTRGNCSIGYPTEGNTLSFTREARMVGTGLVGSWRGPHDPRLVFRIVGS